MQSDHFAPKDRLGSIPAGNATIPGGIYLCQVNQLVSCGACCGVYNVADAAYAPLLALLTERTADFARVPRQADAIADFGRLARVRSGAGPYPDFHHCPFVGLIGAERRRVGCLLHPLSAGNKGVDYRGLSFYGGMACRVYFCAAHLRLSLVIKSIVRETAASWYEYGLVITETTLLNEFFTILENRLGLALRAADILGSRQCRQVMARVLRLKIDWPYRGRPAPGPCHYLFADRLYTKPAVVYPALVAAPSVYDTLLRELRSVFETPADLKRAEMQLTDLIDALAEAIRRGRHDRTPHA
ncbi:MAG: hypothetical protein WAM73_19840 [Desulfobacterales bacterium]